MVERREWALPQTVVQRFQPNEYVAACWKGTCDKAGYVWISNGQYYVPATPDDVHRGGGLFNQKHKFCNETYIWKTENNGEPSQNVIVTEYNDKLEGIPAYYYGGHLMTTIEQDGNHS